MDVGTTLGDLNTVGARGRLKREGMTTDRANAFTTPETERVGVDVEVALQMLQPRLTPRRNEHTSGFVFKTEGFGGRAELHSLPRACAGNQKIGNLYPFWNSQGSWNDKYRTFFFLNKKQPEAECAKADSFRSFFFFFNMLSF